MTMKALDAGRLFGVKPSFTARRVDLARVAWLEEDATGLRAGDLVIATVTGLGHHTNIERPDGRRAKLFTGDEILVACGARYAPDQFEAHAPTASGPAQLVAAGGIVGHVRHAHTRMKDATEVVILGAVCDHAYQRLNLLDFAVRTQECTVRVPIVAVCGTAMNSGKTHTAASLVRGLALAGRHVAAIKVTGTGAGGDLWFFRDAGACLIRDFTDAGFATTYGASVDGILKGFCHLLADAVAAGADAIVVEVADGLHQAETAEVLCADGLRTMLSGVIFAASDAMGAEAGVAWLKRAGHKVLAVSGCLTCSPLAMQEAEAAVGLPCLTADDLSHPVMAASLADPAAVWTGVMSAA